MLLEDLWDLFERKLFSVPSNDGLFNPYNSEAAGLDRPGAAGIRRRNLRSYLSSFPERPTVLLVGEAPGPWGCRFSGIPFTGEAQLVGGTLPFAGQQSSLSPTPYQEMSGQIVWELMRPHHPGFLLSNSVPLHPHIPGKPLSIRTPKSSEVAAYLGLLQAVVEIVKPRLVVAIGRQAERALGMVGMPSVYVRHPSHGGAKAFREGVQKALSS